MTRRPLAVFPSLHGVLLGRVPPLHRYYEDAKPSCHPFRRTSFPSLGDTRGVPRASLPTGPEAPTGRTWSFGSALPLPIYSAGDDRTSHVPEEPSRAFALLSDPGRIDAPWPSRGRRRGPCDFHGKGSGKETFEAQSHGFCTRCLRFAEVVTAPDARLAPAAGSALPDGI